MDFFASRMKVVENQLNAAIIARNKMLDKVFEQKQMLNQILEEKKLMYEKMLLRFQEIEKELNEKQKKI